jgi:hypothetical protein
VRPSPYYVAANVQPSVLPSIRSDFEGAAHLDRAKHTIHNDHFQRSHKAVWSAWLRRVIGRDVKPCSLELIDHCLSSGRIVFERSDDVRTNSERPIVTALLPIDTQLSSERENSLPRQAELVTDLLVSERWISKHRAQPQECSLAVAAIKADGTHHVLGWRWGYAHL